MSQDASSVLREFFAGVFGGAIQVIVGHPIDTIRTRIQNAPTRTSFFAQVVSAVRNDGVLSLFRGLTYPLAGVPLYLGAGFALFDACKTLVGAHADASDYWSRVFAAGCLTGIGTAVIGCPLDLCKIVLQAESSTRAAHESSSGLSKEFAAARQIVRDFGWARLYRGFGVNLVRDFFGYGVYYWSYWGTRALYLNHFGADAETEAIFCGGSVSGVLCWLVIYPLDVLKTRVQADFKKIAYTGAYDCYVKGVNASASRSRMFLAQGLTVTTVRAVPLNVVLFYAYEYGGKLYDRLF